MRGHMSVGDPKFADVDAVALATTTDPSTHGVRRPALIPRPLVCQQKKMAEQRWRVWCVSTEVAAQCALDAP